MIPDLDPRNIEQKEMAERAPIAQLAANILQNMVTVSGIVDTYKPEELVEYALALAEGIRSYIITPKSRPGIIS